MALTISRILHAGYLFENNGCIVAFDPLFENPFSQNCYAFPEIRFDRKMISELRLEAVFLSHHHDDHFSLESLDLIDRKTPIYLFAADEIFFEILRQMGFYNVHSVELGRSIFICDFEIIALEALDREVDSLYHLKVDGLNILNVVDSWIGLNTMEKLRQTSRWDLILWPFQAMRELEVIAPSAAEVISEESQKIPQEWLEQLWQLSPRAIVPSSCQFRFEDWSWYNKAFFPISYDQFEKQIRHVLPSAEVHRLDPGESLRFSDLGWKKQERLSWIHPVGNQNVDYEFQSEITPQSMSEIAQKFLPLSFDQKKWIESYCEHDIIHRYCSLAQVEESFFCMPRQWRLIIYDSNGQATSFQYQILKNQMKQVMISEDWNWKTEIAETKLWGALHHGESLTSIYLRITPAKDTDLFDDPLVRCLYEGIVGGYQKAQLRKIQSAKKMGS